jgi:hypothetical protein
MAAASSLSFGFTLDATTEQNTTTATSNTTKNETAPSSWFCGLMEYSLLQFQLVQEFVG